MKEIARLKVSMNFKHTVYSHLYFDYFYVPVIETSNNALKLKDV